MIFDNTKAPVLSLLSQSRQNYYIPTEAQTCNKSTGIWYQHLLTTSKESRTREPTPSEHQGDKREDPDPPTTIITTLAQPYSTGIKDRKERTKKKKKRKEIMDNKEKKNSTSSLLGESRSRVYPFPI